MKKISLPKGCTLQRIAVPAGPGPFANSKIVSAGCDKLGNERFWIATFNETSGTLGILADEIGNVKPFHFDLSHACFYSAAVEDENTLWLCGDLSRLVRLQLNTGKYEEFPTGAHSIASLPKTVYTHLLNAGMIYDKSTQRVFAAAKLPEARVGFSFDVRTKKSVIYRDQWESLYHFTHFPNGDGTWTLVFYYPGALLRWNPVTQEVTKSSVNIANIPLEQLHHLVHVENLGTYLPTLGWYNAREDRLEADGPRPQREVMWFGARDEKIFGYKSKGSDVLVSAWDIKSGRVDDLFEISETPIKNVAFSKKGNIVAMTLDGEFRVYDGNDMGLKLAKRTPCFSVGNSMCVRLLDRKRIMGTTFITQHFWQGDLVKKKSWDCGRAAPGIGQITQIMRVGKLVYMTAYTGGELVEYDPEKPAAFPVNPRVVAQHPLALRPVAWAMDGPILWYSCSRKYGVLGSVLFRYDTRSGQASWIVDPLGARQIFSMCFDPQTRELICGSTIHSDQAYAKPTETQGMIGRISADDLIVRDLQKTKWLRIEVVGWFKRGQLLCLDFSSDEASARVVDSATLKDVNIALPEVLGNAQAKPPWPVTYAGKIGWFLVKINGQLQLHDFRKRNSLVRVILKETKADRWHVDGDHLLVTEAGQVLIINNALRR